jgi:hypothetical protein
MSRDPALLASTFTANVAFLGMSWKQMLGRPTITLLATQYLLGKPMVQIYSLADLYGMILDFNSTTNCSSLQVICNKTALYNTLSSYLKTWVADL